MTSSRMVSLALTAIVLLFVQTGRGFAEYPERPVRVLLPFPAGGAVDIVARVMIGEIAADLGKTFVIENKSGAGGIVATEAAAKSSPDGYTLLITTPNHTINAALQSSLPYDPERDLVPISVLAEVPMVLVSYPGAPFTNFDGFVAYAQTGHLRHFPCTGRSPRLADAGHCLEPPFEADARHADHRRAGLAELSRHSLDRHDGAGGHPAGGDRQTCFCERKDRERTRRGRAIAARWRRSGRWHAGAIRIADRARIGAMARACQGRQHQFATMNRPDG
jgi:hypothetical protein